MTISATAVAIVPLSVEHWPQVQRVYAAGIASDHATFEENPPTWGVFDQSKLADHRLVAVDDNAQVLGWAAASAVSDRCAYAGVVEHSVYVDPVVERRGIGLQLLEALIYSTEAAGIWTIQSGIFPENTVSLRLHERAGFHTVGTRQRVGRMTYGSMAGTWRDVILVERRSDTVGI